MYGNINKARMEAIDGTTARGEPWPPVSNQEVLHITLTHAYMMFTDFPM